MVCKVADYIVFRPNFDEATIHSDMFSQLIVDHLTSQGDDFIDLRAEDATPAKGVQALKDHPEAMFIFFDHGDERSLIAQDRTPVIDLDNRELLYGRETFTLACLAGKILLYEVWRGGGLACYGSVEIVSFTTDAKKEFGEAFTFAWFQRYQEKEWPEVLVETKRRILELRDHLTGQGRLLAASCMQSYHDSLVCYDGGSDPPEPTTCPGRMTVLWLCDLLHIDRKWAWKLPGRSTFETKIIVFK